MKTNLRTLIERPSFFFYTFSSFLFIRKQETRKEHSKERNEETEQTGIVKTESFSRYIWGKLGRDYFLICK